MISQTLSVTEKPIWIGNDHGGLQLKRTVLEHLERRGHAAHDVGSHVQDIVRYPLYAQKVAQAVGTGAAVRGILICSTGIGMSIMANKFSGVRASLCTTPHMGRMTRAHNDSNVLCLGGQITPPDVTLQILDAWLETPFEGGRHCISLELIRQGEQELFRQAEWLPRVESL